MREEGLYSRTGGQLTVDCIITLSIGDHSVPGDCEKVERKMDVLWGETEAKEFLQRDSWGVIAVDRCSGNRVIPIMLANRLIRTGSCCEAYEVIRPEY